MQWNIYNDNTVFGIFNSLSIQKILLEPVAFGVIAMNTPQSHCMNQSFENPRQRVDCFPTLWYILKPAFWNRSDIACYLPFVSKSMKQTLS